MEKLQNYIGGEFVDASSGKSFDSVNPSTGEKWAVCPRSDSLDAELAVKSASEAFYSWKKKSVKERARILNKIADLIEENTQVLARIESIDNGKPAWLCEQVDIPRAAANFRYFAEAVTQFSSQSYEMEGAINYVLKQPLGPVVCISPWNLPLYLFTWKIAPALAVGNSVIAKPSEVTPASAFHLAKICLEAGLPDGVLNICHGYGDEIGTSLVTHPSIKAVSFTGGTTTGRLIAQECAKKLIPCSLELGGKNPAVVFADCDLEYTVRNLVRSSFTNQGQICLCSSRIIVEDSIYDEFKELFLEATKKLKVGPPDAKDSDLGAIVSKEHFEKILGCIEKARDEGGSILVGGSQYQIMKGDKSDKDFSKGYYISPTVIEGLDNLCETNQEEIFGPVVTIQRFHGYDKSISLANESNYGLSATIWTSDLNTAHRAARDLEAGIVWINTWLLRDLRTPFGGVKQSGLGREGGFDALEFFTEKKNVCVAYDI